MISWSLRARLTCAFSILLLALLGTSLVWFRSATLRDIRREEEGLVQASLTRLVEISPRNVRELKDFWADERILAPVPLALAIFDGRGHLLANAGLTLPDPDAPGWLLRTRQVGSSLYVVASPHARRLQALGRTTLRLAGAGIVVWVLSTGAAWLLVGLTLSPLARLTRQAESHQAPLVSPSNDRELVELVRVLNAFLTNIRRTVQARASFYAAASHELRTPLQALQGHLELALSKPRSAEEYRAALEEAHLQGQRLSRLVRALLLLNRIETESQVLREPVDLALVLQARAADLNCERLDLQLQPCPVECDPSYAEILVGNLLENALKYSPADTQVHVSSGTGVVRVVNRTLPDLRWSPARLFEPFFRHETSRSSAAGGNGLGLALCKSVADLHGWGLKLDYQHGLVSAELNCTPLAGG